jgi:NodT family efflux transporter outer membrane factor (OMF) lipoprotein
MSARNSDLSRSWAIALLLCGCAVGPNFHAPVPPAGKNYNFGGDPQATVPAAGVTQNFVAGGLPARDWWRGFKAPALDGVIAQALSGNPGLAAAHDSLLAAQDNLRAGYGIFLPWADLNTDAERERSNPTISGFRGAPSLFSLFTLSTTISYTLDIWGGERRAVEALAAGADQARAEERATYLTLTGNAATTAIAIAAYRDEITATEKIVALDREQQRLATIQAVAGTATYATMLALQAQLHVAEQSLPPLRQHLSAAEHLLATLCGNLPADRAPPVLHLADFTLPRDLPLSLPAQLVRQRPDIMLAAAELHESGANVGVATAAMLPAITLSGSYGNSANSSANLFSGSAVFWSLGSGLSAPLFEGGTLWYKRKAALENYHQSQQLYRQTVLSAFTQVADALRALENDAKTLDAALKSQDTAATILKLTEANHEAGLSSDLDVLNAEQAYEQSRIMALAATATRYQDTVALFAALGGGW